MKAAQIKSSALAFLNRHGRVTDKQLARFIAMSPCTAWKYLSTLREEELAHRTYDPLATGKGGCVVFFNAGPKPEALKDTFDSRESVKAWEPMGIVDPWMLPMDFFKPAGIAA